MPLRTGQPVAVGVYGSVRVCVSACVTVRVSEGHILAGGGPLGSRVHPSSPRPALRPGSEGLASAQPGRNQQLC